MAAVRVQDDVSAVPNILPVPWEVPVVGIAPIVQEVAELLSGHRVLADVEVLNVHLAARRLGPPVGAWLSIWRRAHQECPALYEHHGAGVRRISHTPPARPFAPVDRDKPPHVVPTAIAVEECARHFVIHRFRGPERTYTPCAAIVPVELPPCVLPRLPVHLPFRPINAAMLVSNFRPEGLANPYRDLPPLPERIPTTHMKGRFRTPPVLLICGDDGCPAPEVHPRILEPPADKERDDQRQHPSRHILPVLHRLIPLRPICQRCPYQPSSQARRCGRQAGV